MARAASVVRMIMMVDIRFCHVRPRHIRWRLRLPSPETDGRGRAGDNTCRRPAQEFTTNTLNEVNGNIIRIAVVNSWAGRRQVLLPARPRPSVSGPGKRRRHRMWRGRTWQNRMSTIMIIRTTEAARAIRFCPRTQLFA